VKRISQWDDWRGENFGLGLRSMCYKNTCEIIATAAALPVKQKDETKKCF
jgi:hypothetical protein